MNDNSDLPKPFEAFLIIVFSFIFVVIVTQVLSFIFVPETEEGNPNSLALKMLITFGEIGLILVPFVYVRSRGLSYKKVFRWNKVPGPILLWSFLIGLGISFVGDELDRLINIIIPAPEFLEQLSEALKIASISDFFLLGIGAVVIAAFIEESIIRGFLQTSLEKYQDVTRAVIYASLAWTIIHGVIYWAIQIFLMGIILGLLAWRSNSIVPSVIGHATNNAAAILFYNINQEKLRGIYLWGNHVSPLVLIMAVIFIFWGVKTFYQYYGISDGEHRP
ncbi:MAG: hypothetical protein Kow0042_16420 [Calditrichia bacterium]